jgi:predicted kinase
MLTVVIGPPAGGKSTWVLERAKPGDIVVDFDRLAFPSSTFRDW